MEEIRYIFCDTETTGLSPQNGDKMVEFCLYETDEYGNPVASLCTLVNPERDIPEEVIRIHGIDNNKVIDAPLWRQIVPKMVAFLSYDGLSPSNRKLIIHNAPFDIGFIETQTREVGGFENFRLADYVEVVDTVAIAKSVYPGEKVKLDILCDRLKVDRSERILHGALLDCRILSEVFFKLMPLFEDK